MNKIGTGIQLRRAELRSRPARNRTRPLNPVCARESHTLLGIGNGYHVSGVTQVAIRKTINWSLAAALLAMCGLAACGAYVRSGTAVIADFVSPDRKWDAVLMVRNGGAMTGYATVVSVVKANWPARQLALYRPTHAFVADDNDGAVPWGRQGVIDVKVRWASPTELVVTYPEKSHVSKKDPSYESVSIQYVASQ